MSTLFVSDLQTLAQSVETVRPSRVLTCIDPKTPLPDLTAFVEPDRHLRLYFHDIEDAVSAEVPPATEHIERIVAWGDEVDQAGLLIHCYAGTSRSTAAAFILLCRHNPGAERLAATVIREQGPHARPNRRMVHLADDLLGRRGAMVEAIDTMDQPHGLCFERLMRLPLRFEADSPA